MGDFNYKNIDWDLSASPASNNPNSEEDQFVNCLMDNYWQQFVTAPTRKRGHDQPSLLDLIISNEPYSIDEIIHESPLGLSDHSMLIFDYQCYMDYKDSGQSRPQVHKANIEEIKKCLDINWDNLLDNKTVEEQWQKNCWNTKISSRSMYTQIEEETKEMGYSIATQPSTGNKEKT